MSQNSIGECRMQTAKSMHIPRALLTSPMNGSTSGVEQNFSNKIWNHSTHKINSIKDENKTSFSEKLKVLLANGSLNDAIDDPYDFRDVELQGFAAPVLNSSDANYKCSKSLKNGAVLDENNVPCNNYANNKQKDVPAAAVPIYVNSAKHPNSTLFTFKQCDMLPRHPAEAAKVKSPLLKNPKSNLSSTRSATNHIHKTSPKSSITANIRGMGISKPLNFGKSQMSKLAIAKIEKTLEIKKNSLKGSPSLCSNQKTAFLNKLYPKPKVRSVAVRSASLDSDVSIKTNSKYKTKLNLCKSLLEESLLGIKPNDSDASWEVERKNSSPEMASPEAASTRVFLPTLSNLKHESLERLWMLRNKLRLLKTNYQQFGLLVGDMELDSLDTDSDGCLFQNHWFSLCHDYNSFAGHNRKREAKLAQLKTDLRHKLKQHQWRHKDDYREKFASLLIDTARTRPNIAAFLIRLHSSQFPRNKPDRPVAMSQCTFTECISTSVVPGAPYCLQHIHHQPSQLLFTRCFAEGVMCHSPALVKNGGTSLCSKHDRRQISALNDIQTEKSILHSKRNRSSLCSNRAGRSRKRKRHMPKDKKEVKDVVQSLAGRETLGMVRESNENGCSNGFTLITHPVDETNDVEVGEEVLTITSAELPLDSVELATLATQATGLLEEHDFTNVLNHMPADAFNDLFTEDKEEYEPTAQETEELERALAAVDNDVKTLETQAQDLFQMLGDSNLNLMPDVVPVLYQNGFASISAIAPLEQAICEALPNPLLISPHADILQS